MLTARGKYGLKAMIHLASLQTDTTAQASEIAKTNSFFLATRDLAARSPDVLRTVIDTVAATAEWAEANRDKVAKALAEVTGIDLEIQTIAADRSSFVIGKLTDEIIATQQAVADRFSALHLIPKPITIRDAVWSGALA